jgi:hypothetical protein
MNRKSWMVVLGLMALALGIGLSACGKLHPAPEVGILTYAPVVVPVSDTTTDSQVQVTFVVHNGVDAVLTSMQESIYRGTTRDTLATTFARARLSFPIDASTTGAILVITYPKASKKNYANYIGDSGIVVFYGEDAYGNGKTFSDSIGLSYD